MKNSHNFSIKITLYRYDPATDSEGELDVEASGCIEAGEKQSWDSPGCDPYCEIHSVMFEGIDLLDFLTPEELEEIEEKAFEHSAESALAAQEARYEAMMDR